MLKQASRCCFLTGVGDLAEELCRVNMAYGLAKIRYVQQQMGIRPDACFVGAPDATVTRNVDRWEAGFSYGGRIRFSGDFAVLSVKSNCCGIYLGLLPDLPDSVSVLERIRALQEDPQPRSPLGGGACGNAEGGGGVRRLTPPVAGTAISWDFAASNHFVSVVRMRTPWRNRPYAVLLHGSGPELRSEGPHGPGLYADASAELSRMATREDTPWGPLLIAKGPQAAQFFSGYKSAEEAAKQRRSVIARSIFPEVEDVCNTTHQGLLACNDILLGCLSEAPGSSVPIVLRADLPVYIVQARPNLSGRILEKTGMGPWAERLGLYDRVAHADLLPHGGGYSIPTYRRVERVEQMGTVRVFVLRTGKGTGALVHHRNFRHVPYGYRGEEVIRQVESLELGNIVAVADPVLEYMV